MRYASYKSVFNRLHVFFRFSSLQLSNTLQHSEGKIIAFSCRLMTVYVNLYQIILNIFYPHQFSYIQKIPKNWGKKTCRGKKILLSFLHSLHWWGNPDIWAELSTVAKTFHVTLDTESVTFHSLHQLSKYVFSLLFSLYLSFNICRVYFILAQSIQHIML